MADACNDTMGTLTVGQASNPGPPGPLRWISTLSASVVTYALPGQLGFHGAHTAGHAADLCPPSDPFVLKLATANTTGWRPLQNFLCTTDANVIFAQEHRLLEDAIPMASAWARNHGWKSVWAPAKRGSGGGASAGTVVLARDVMGLRHPDRGGAVVADAHAVAAVIEPPSSRPFIGYAAYYLHGQGLSKANLALTADIGAHWEMQADDKLQMVLAADFNMRPEMFARAGLANRIWGRAVAPGAARGTCRTRSGATTYDYFLYVGGPGRPGSRSCDCRGNRCPHSHAGCGHLLPAAGGAQGALDQGAPRGRLRHAGEPLRTSSSNSFHSSRMKATTIMRISC